MGKDKPFFAEVTLALPLNKNLHYQVPPHLQESIEVGSRVLVPLEKRKVTGYVLEFKTSSDVESIKPIEAILDPFPLFGPSDLNFFKWIASYYLSPLGAVIKNALPSGINIGTHRYFSLTPRGREALSNQQLSPLEKQVLVLLEKKRQIAPNRLKMSLKEEKCLPLLSSLEQKGFIALSEREGSRIIKPHQEKVFNVNEDMLSRLSFSDLKRMLKKASRQFQVLKFLRKQGGMSQAKILSHWGKARSALNSLEAKKLITCSYREVYREPFVDGGDGVVPPLELTSEQAEALQKIIFKIHERQYSAFLLHGITGSGKTEVYLRAIDATLEAGRGALVLVPEIALTPQLLGRFKVRFGNKIAQLHSGLSKGERFDEWRRIKNEEVQIVIGARSAIFAPVNQLGIVVVDEEHDSAYKQDERICYNARDLALVKGKMNDAVVILGSATPSIETYHNTKIGKLNYLYLSQRIDNRPLPRVEVLDMRKEEPGAMLSSRLKEAIKNRWERREQTLLFLNRRGFSPFVMCRECGYTFRCPNCQVSLVFHRNKNLLLCHYCDFYKPAPDLCPNCQGYKVEIFGFGTERLEEEVSRLFQDLKVGRLDRDTTARKNALQQILRQFREGETELLIGTQMIAKGHDLPRVTLVGVVAADHSLNFPDFRAGERTFQLLTQVAGRSGRGQIPGEVIIQTYNPGHPSIRMAMAQDFLPFYEEEISSRKELKYPPFYRLVNFRMTGNNLSRTRDYAAQLGKLCWELMKKAKSYKENIEILGPVEAPREKLKGKYRWHMLVKGLEHRTLHSFAEKVMVDIKPHIKISGVKLGLDVDPLDLL